MSFERQQAAERTAARPHVVEATINYVAPMDYRPKFHAQDHSRDNLRYDPHSVQIHDARTMREPPSLDREGLMIARCQTAVRDFRDPDDVRKHYLPEIQELLSDLTGADEVVVLGGGGLVRYTERSPLYKTGMNTQPARFPHVDFTPNTSPGLVDDVFGAPGVKLRPGERIVGYNLWRALSEPPQDVPLAVCDAQTVAPQDLAAADGVYDDGDPSTWWELEAYLLRYNPAHRWIYYRDMTLDEVLIFRGYDNLGRRGVPHSAFDDPSCAPAGQPRVSIEARAYAVYR